MAKAIRWSRPLKPPDRNGQIRDCGDGFEVEPVHLVGHSYGATVALKIAAMRPDKIQSLTLIEPAAFNAFWTAHGHMAPEAQGFARMGDTVQSLVAMGAPEQAMQRFIDFWNGKDAWRNSSPDLRSRLMTCLPQVVEDFRSLQADAMTSRDLSGIVCPVQIMHGTDSPEVMCALTSHLMRRLPFASELVVENAGHMLPLTDPHLTDPAIAAFLNRVDHLWQSCENPFAQAA